MEPLDGVKNGGKVAEREESADGRRSYKQTRKLISQKGYEHDVSRVK